MNGAPDWQDGECCFRCRTQFTLVARKHHCRNCGNIFCAKCSSQQIPIPRLNIDKAVRVCDGCYEKISNKSADPLTLALDSDDKEQVKRKSSSSKSSSSSATKSNANASAPSEQELKEEEELQLALALSLSETPTKVSFPDCRQFEEPSPALQPPPITTVASSTPVSVAPLASSLAAPTPVVQSISNATEQTNYSSLDKSAPQQQQQPVQAPPPPFEYYLQDRDREVFNYVYEIQSTLEIFNNRLNACKLRNRPIANDSAIQSLFLKLNTEFQPRLTEYIKTYEEERAGYERLQDKLSQIADARAALDALREEHQEKMRQLAAEAEMQRQSQLATKLEAMRQKKSQMMQYQRELALQRIKEQEMMLQQQQQQPPQQQSSQVYQQPSVTTVHQHQPLPGPSLEHVHQLTGFSNPTIPPISNNSYAHPQPAPSYPQQAPSYQPVASHEYPANTNTQQVPYNPIQQQSTQVPPQQPQVFQTYAPQPAPDYSALAKFEQQYLPKPPKPDEDTPLISFDD